MILRDLPESNRHVAPKPGFRGQQIVKARVASVLRDVEADGEKIPRRIVEKVEIHRRQRFRLPCETGDCVEPLASQFTDIATFSGFHRSQLPQ